MATVGVDADSLLAALLVAAAPGAFLAAVVLATDGSPAGATLVVTTFLPLATAALNGFNLSKRGGDKADEQPRNQAHEHPPLGSRSRCDVSYQGVESRAVHPLLLRLNAGLVIADHAASRAGNRCAHRDIVPSVG